MASMALERGSHAVALTNMRQVFALLPLVDFEYIGVHPDEALLSKHCNLYAKSLDLTTGQTPFLANVKSSPVPGA